MPRVLVLMMVLVAFMAHARAEAIHVFAAASLKNALDEIGDAWGKTAEDRNIVVTYAASSALAKQIAAGAPVDVFISADTAWMDNLESQSLIDRKTLIIIAGNNLVLIAPVEATHTINLKDAASVTNALGDGRLAIADVNAVPAGKYGKAALQHFSLWTKIEPHLAQTENVRAALALVARGEAPLGIVYGSDAMAEKSVRVVAEFPADSHPAIFYPAARIATSTNPLSETFLHFLGSAVARSIFARHGFTAAP
jgi:molybdate transport system substrate-binding protein